MTPSSEMESSELRADHASILWSFFPCEGMGWNARQAQALQPELAQMRALLVQESAIDSGLRG